MADRVRLLGPIERLQVQREPVRDTETGVYHPQHIVPVGRLVVGPPGLVAPFEGAWLVDVHHATHPRRRGDGGRAISIGFTSHYRRMEERYGVVPLGIAGENLIVHTDDLISFGDAAAGFVIRTGTGEEVHLKGLRPATACVEFTSFLLGFERAIGRGELAEDLAFLSDGTRGFVGSLSHLEIAHRVAVGDLVYIVEPD